MDWSFLDAQYGPHNERWGRFVKFIPLDVIIAVAAAVFVGFIRMVLTRKVLIV